MFFRRKKARMEEASTRETVSDREESAQTGKGMQTGNDAGTLGPFDAAQGIDIGSRTDLGCLWLSTSYPMSKIKYEIDQSSGTITSVLLDLGRTVVRINLFAAPTSEKMWDNIRAEIISQIAAQGGSFEEVEGEFGKEVKARLARGASMQAVRFLGIDGRRWLLRVTISGSGAIDEEEYRHVVHNVLDDLVVNRGKTPYPPGELIPLHVQGISTVKENTPEGIHIRLPQRGPEITEVH